MGVAFVMGAVFIPVAFMSGPVGIFYRQFSITMATAIILSGVVALTLTPALCAMILKNNHGKKKKKNPVDKFLDGFNNTFNRGQGKYVQLLGHIVTRRGVTFLILG